MPPEPARAGPAVARPPRLPPGGTIGVAAVSGAVDLVRLDRGIARLTGLGYRVVAAANVRKSDGLFAGSDAERAAGYGALLADPSVDAIFFARGGWGAGRILDRLDPRDAAARPRIHLGGSDLTSLFAFLERAGVPGFYGPMVAVEIAQEDGLDWRDVLSGSPPADHAFGEADALAGGEGEGPLAGGCLTLLASLCGTPEAISGKGRVLFWEDIGEEIYRLDRMLTQLERSGTFDGLQAMVIGSVVPRDRGESPGRVRDYLQSRFAHAPFPVAMGFPAGHLARPRTLPLGVRARLEIGSSCRLAFREPAVL